MISLRCPSVYAARHGRALRRRQRGFIINPYAFSAAADPTLSLLHFDGSDGSTTFIDEFGGTWTATADAQLDTAQQKFGASSLLVDGTGDFITMDSPSIALGLGDYTIECFVRFAALSGNNFAFLWGANFGVYVFGGNVWAIFNGVSANVVQSSPMTINTGVWYHVAAVRASLIVSLYVDGIRLGLNSEPADHSTAFLRIGTQLNGHIDEFRVSNVALYSGASFTPPAAPFLP